MAWACCLCPATPLTLDEIAFFVARQFSALPGDESLEFLKADP